MEAALVEISQSDSPGGRINMPASSYRELWSLPLKDPLTSNHRVTISLAMVVVWRA